MLLEQTKTALKCTINTYFYVQFQCFVEQNWFHLIGIICGLAIYNSTVVDLHFPLLLYKKLLDVLPTLEDFKELSPTEARSSLFFNTKRLIGFSEVLETLHPIVMNIYSTKQNM